MKFTTCVCLAVFVTGKVLTGSKVVVQVKPSNSNTLNLKPRFRIKKIKDISDHKSIEFIGNKRISQARMEEIIKQERNPQKIQDLLIASGLFKTVKTAKKGSQLQIIVTENPVISEITFGAKGAFFIGYQVFLENLNIKVGEIFNKDKLNRAIETVRQISMYITGAQRVKVKAKQILEQNNQVRLKFEVTVQQVTRIRKAKFIGNKQLTDAELYRNLHRVKVIQHPIPIIGFEEFNQGNLYEHKRSLEKYATSRGFLDFTVKNVSIVDGIFHIIIDEGERYRINRVQITNECPDLKTKIIQRYAQSLQVGDVCNTKTTEYVESQIIQDLIKQGLNRYNVKINFNKLDKNKVNLEIKVYPDPQAFKLRRIVVRNNFKVREDVIRDRFKVQPGDYISDSVIKESKKRIEKLQPIQSVEHEFKSDDGEDLDIFDLPAENPFESKASPAKITSIQSKSTSNKEDVLELSVTEVKKPTLLSFLWQTGNNDFSVNLHHNNLCGKCATGTIHVKSLEELLLGFSFPDHQTGVTYSFKFIGGVSSIGSNYFEPSSIIDFFVNSATEYKHRTPAQFAQTLREATVTNPEAPLRKSAQPRVKLASNWDYAKKEVTPIQETYAALSAMIHIPVTENSRLTLGLTGKNRSFTYAPDTPEALTYRVKTLTNISRYQSGIMYRRWSDFSSEEQKELLLSGRHQQSKDKQNRHNKTTKPSLEEKLGRRQKPLEKIYNDGQITRIATGTGLSPVLKPAISEKIEFIPHIEYSKTFFFPRINQSRFSISGKLNPIFGTTTALKTEIHADFYLPITQVLLLELDYMVGWSINSHYLDNFRSSNLGLCQVMGPVELYNFTELGGKFMTKFVSRLFYIFEIDPLLTFYPNISLSWGGLSNSGLEAHQMPDTVLEVRKWPKHTLDIAQNDFKSVVILSPGMRVKMGPLMLGFKVNTSLAGKTKFNLVRPIDLEFGLQL